MDDDEYEVYRVFEEPRIVPDLDDFLPPLNFVQDPEPQILQPLPEPQPQPQPEMMVHVADLNPVVELYEVLPVAGFPYPPLAYRRRKHGAFADVESLALFTAFHRNGNVREAETLRDMYPHILGLRDEPSLNAKLRSSINSAERYDIALLTLVPPVVVIPPPYAGGNQAGH